MGTMGSFSSSSQTRTGGIAAYHQQRPVQSSFQPQTTPNNQSPASQSFQGHGLLRASSSSVGSPSSPSPGTSQSSQSHNRPWLSSGSQGKPPLPSPPFRSQMNPQSLHQRSHFPQQHHHPMSTATQQQQMPSSQQSQSQPPVPLHPPQEHYAHPFPPSRALNLFAIINRLLGVQDWVTTFLSCGTAQCSSVSSPPREQPVQRLVNLAIGS